MKETKFIEQNKEKWAAYEQMLQENRRDPEKLNELFIQITDDLSYARTFYPNRSVRVFLNGLAQRIFHNIYRGRRFPAERLRLFWAVELPRTVWETRRALLLSFALFVLAFGIGMVSSMIDPQFARVILGDEYVDMTLANIESGDPMAVYKDAGPFGMAAGITANNLFVALRTAILGVLASIGTVFIMLYNGIMVGAFQYFFVEQGVFWDSFLTIWIHGTLEISAIIIAGAAGMVAGSGLLFPGTYRRTQAFQISMRQGLKIFIGIVPIIVLAGFFESFLTRFTETPDAIRAAFIACSLAFVLWYFVWLPWHKARTGAFERLPADKAVLPDRRRALDFTAIKTVGEVLADAFTVLSRHPRTVVAGLFATSTLFCAWTFGLSGKDAASTLSYPETAFWPFDVFVGSAQFFSGETAWGLFYFQSLLLSGIALAAFRALRQEAAPGQPHALGVVGTLALVLVMGCVAKTMGHFSEWGVAASWVVMPFCGLWAAVLYFENRNPAAAVERAWQLFRLGPALGLGLLTGLLNLLLFMFLESPIWEMSQQLVSWTVPPTAGAMAAFSAVSLTFAAGAMLYFFVLLTMVCCAIQFFSLREIKDAESLHKALEQVGQARKIRGLARE
jgi:uncharacterized membrane protein SpoIIM required for sporulation